MTGHRKYPIGAEMMPGGVHFRVWAPKRKSVQVALADGGPVPLVREQSGYFSGLVEGVREGSLYRFQLDGGDLFPDPASRFQPEGPHGPSMVVDPGRFQWSDQQWRGEALERPVIYEMHIGTFTREGTWRAAVREFAELSRAGITVLEIMPVADFPGKFNWGYDGVGMFAPVAIYGAPDDFRAAVDEAHKLGMAVILDVVYNHIGPEGNYLKQFSDGYFTKKYENEWGEAINYDGDNSRPVREWAETNAAYWIDEYHLDGLRLDATQQIFDDSPEHILTSLGRKAREAAGSRRVFIVAENEPQDSMLVRPPEQGGNGLDALWNDDFHHTMRVALTGHNEAYYSDYRGTPQELISAIKYGFLYQGQPYTWQAKRRGGAALDLRPEHFVTYIENHDQIANSGNGERTRLLTSPGRYRALTALLILSPASPMLFQGQEFGASSPFSFFADLGPGLREAVKEGRIQFLSQFPSLAQPEARSCHKDPSDPAVFEACKLDFKERETNAAIYEMYKELLRIRREDSVFGARPSVRYDGAVLSPDAFVLRFFGQNGDDRLLVVNMGVDLRLAPAPEPLLAPPAGKIWNVFWSSEEPRFGGCGTPPLERSDCWVIPGNAAAVLRPGEPVWPA
jgi:maltooligosyltrehalose trehalohydrolase